MARLNPTRTPSGITTFLGGILLLAIFAGIIVWWITANRPKDDIEARRAAARISTREQLTKQYGERLSGMGWTDKAQGVAHIPIEDAIHLAIAELKNKHGKPSTVKVEAPLPIVAPDPASTEPPPSALPAAPQGADTISFAIRTPEPSPGGAGAPGGQPPVPSSNAPAPAPTPTTAPASLPAAPVPQAPAAPAAGQPTPNPAISSPAPASEPAAPAPAPPAQPAAPAPTPPTPPTAPTAGEAAPPTSPATSSPAPTAPVPASSTPPATSPAQ